MMNEDGTGIMFRFWTFDNKRMALWRVWYDGRHEYHVSTARGTTIIEDLKSAYGALRRAAANHDAYRLLADWIEANPDTPINY